MSKYWLFLFVCGLLSAFSSVAQEYDLYPKPRQVTFGENKLLLSAMPSLKGETTAYSLAVKRLKCLFPDTLPVDRKLTAVIGERGDKAIRKYESRIPSRPEGYYLLVQGRTIVIAGNDERGTLYGVRTLEQLFKDGVVPEVEIVDYPEIAFRGVVEGFYGTPWSMEDRAEQLRFYGKYKLNTYIYGPKDDPYHRSPNWRDPYPRKEAEAIKRLVEVANESGVDFVWAIHPGQDIRWTDEDRDNLLRKFESMYDLGVRAFAVFFDDISGEGTNPERQAALLNYIDEYFVKKKGDVIPLLMCPTDYAKAWAQNGSYIGKMGDLLNPSINVMFTGDAVIASITRECVEWVDAKLKRPVYIWWNFPVTDYIRNRVLMGPVYGNDTTLTGDEMRGFVSNPMEHAEASKVAIYGVAGYTWNPSAYDSQAAWVDVMGVLMPRDADALRCFASHNSDPGALGWHAWQREESVEIADCADRLMRIYEKGLGTVSPEEERMANEFDYIVECADRLLVNKDNPALVRELEPWFRQFKLQGETGRELFAMLRAYRDGDEQRFLAKYRHVRALQEQTFLLDQTCNQNPYQPGIIVGTRVLQPFINHVFTTVVKAANAAFGMELDMMSEYSPHEFMTTVKQLEGLPVQVKGGNVQLSPVLEVVRWGVDEEFQILFKQPLPVMTIQLYLGKSDRSSWQLSVQLENGTWKELPLEEKNGEYFVSVGTKVKAVKFANVSGKAQEVFLRKFFLQIQK